LQSINEKQTFPNFSLFEPKNTCILYIYYIIIYKTISLLYYWWLILLGSLFHCKKYHIISQCISFTKKRVLLVRFTHTNCHLRGWYGNTGVTHRSHHRNSTPSTASGSTRTLAKEVAYKSERIQINTHHIHSAERWMPSNLSQWESHPPSNYSQIFRNTLRSSADMETTYQQQT
jgi:hypothetical protein